MKFPIIQTKIKESDEAIEKLIKKSVGSRDFFLMVFFSILMATFGVLMESITVVIGSMLIAPMLFPLLSLGMGIVMLDLKLVGHSLATLIQAIILSVIAAVLVTIIFPSQEISVYNNVISLVQPSALYAAVAIVAGLAASFAFAKPNLNETLPGVAISVAIIPPLAVVGAGIANQEWGIVRDAASLFIISAVGIILASTIVFFFLNFFGRKKVAEKALKEEIEHIEDGKK